ncbi:hypothetical protein OHU34_20620 [Streptomyces sp. NBC_00080]|uniref:hypothetical protein n=1 Tax=unclassified Streptomyces TaxID=2593676 RepID=UPI001356D76D|nr:hypothetical protein [Streptomyces sp. SLBN-115]
MDEDFADGGRAEPGRAVGVTPPAVDGPGTAAPVPPAPGTARRTRTGVPLGAEPV